MYDKVRELAEALQLDHTASIIELDTTLSPEERLWRTVLNEGIKGAVVDKDQDDQNWLVSMSEEVGSFRWICWHTQLDPDVLRELIDDQWRYLKRRLWYLRLSRYWGTHEHKRPERRKTSKKKKAKKR